jgi:hypothetical protein
VDLTLGLSYGMDLSPLITDTTKDLAGYVLEYIQRFTGDIQSRLTRLG